jgi:two-component sensor histidine kinase
MVDLMVESGVPARTWSGGEEVVLLRELCHRAGNDCAVALSALRLVGHKSMAKAGERSRLVQQVTARLEASAELHRLLARPISVRIEAGAWLAAVCLAAAAAGPQHGGRVQLDVPEMWLDGTLARRLGMVAAELVANAVKYAAGADLSVTVRAALGGVRLLIVDRGPGIVPGSRAQGRGLGSGIVADLVALGGGRLSIETGPAGTTVSVEMPTDAPGALGRGAGR